MTDKLRYPLGLFILFIGFLSSGFFLFAEKKNLDGYHEYELKLTKIIGEKYYDDEKAAIFQIASVDTDSKGNIYILDAGRNKVLKYDKNGDFIKSWGKEGNGPGELNLVPGFLNDSLLIDQKDEIYVICGGKTTIFSSDGELIDNYKSKPFIGFDIDAEDRLIIGKSLQYREDKAIHVYYRDNLIGEFGTHPFNKVVFENKVNPRFLSGYTESIVTLGKDSIYNIYRSFPIVQKYSFDGKLLWEKHLSVENISFIPDKYKEELKDRYNPRKKGFTKPADFPPMIAEYIGDAQTFEDYTYIFFKFENYVVLKLDKNGNLKSSYSIDPIIESAIKGEKMGLPRFRINKKTGRIMIYKTMGSLIYEVEMPH